MECKVRDITMYYEEAGTGRPPLMLHGRPLDHRHMMDDMEPLFVGRTGWRRIYPDLPGRGKTPAPDWLSTMDQMLEIVLDFSDTVAPGQRIVVAGMSNGGYLAQGVVYRRLRRVDGLMLCVAAIEADKSRQHLPPHQVLVEEPGFITALQPDEQVMRNLLVIQNQETLAQFRRAWKAGLSAADWPFLNRLEQHDAFSFPADTLPEPFPAPTLILAGRQDARSGYRDAWQILENYPRATFAVLDRAGHALVLEQRALFTALVSEWLDRVEEYAHTASNPKL